MRWLRDGRDRDGKEGCLAAGSRLRPGIMQPAVLSMKRIITLATIQGETDLRLDGWLDNDARSVPAASVTGAHRARRPSRRRPRPTPKPSPVRVGSSASAGGLREAESGCGAKRGPTPGAAVSPTPCTAATLPMASLESNGSSERDRADIARRHNRRCQCITVLSHFVHSNDPLPARLQG